MIPSEWQRRLALLGIGLRSSLRGSRAMAIRNVAVVLCTVLAVVVLGAVWQAPAAGSHRGEVRTLREPWPTGTVEAPLAGFDPAAGPVMVRPRESRWGDRPLTVVDVAAPAGALPVAPPGVPSLPQRGEVVASPALAELLASAAGTDLAVRVPGEVTGLIAERALAEPGELYAYVGRAPGELADGFEIAGWGSPLAAEETVGGGALILLVFAGAATVVPLAYLIGAALRIFSDRRERRLAALSLVGVPPADQSWVLVGETVPLLGIGFAAAVVLFQPLLGLVTGLLPPGHRVFAADLSPTLAQLPLLALVVLAIAGAAAYRSTKQVSVSPLGTVRRAAIPPLRRRALLLPLAGVLALAVVNSFSDELAGGSVAVTALAFAGLAMIVLGMAPVVRLLTRGVAALIARLSERRPAADLAARQLLHNPTGTHRVATLVALLVFGAAVPQAIFPLLAAAEGITGDATANLPAESVLVLADGPVPDALLADLEALGPVATVYRTGITSTADQLGTEAWVVACADLPLVFAAPPAGCGSDVMWMADAEGLGLPFGASPSTYAFDIDQRGELSLPGTFELPAAQPFGQPFPELIVDGAVLVVPLEALPADVAAALAADPFRAKQYVVGTADAEAVREAAWALPQAFRELGWAVTPAELLADHQRQIDFFTRLVTIGLAVALGQAMLGVFLTALALATEQRHAVALTWAIGMRPSRFVRAQAIRAVAPLAVAAVVGGVAGGLVGYLYLRFADAAGNPLLDGPLLGLDAAGLALWTAVGLGIGVLAAAVTLPVTIRRPSLAELRAE